jgi:hypothetical protein
MPELDIDLDTVAFIVERAREFEVPEGISAIGEEGDEQVEGRAVSEPPPDDLDVMKAQPVTDTPYQEAKAQIESMNIDEQCELVALAWIGRGDYTVDDWEEAVRTARQEHNKRTAEYLLGMPHLPDHLQTALDYFDRPLTS